jgi:ankyrin repeat protein
MGCCESLLCPVPSTTELIEAAKQGDVTLMASLIDNGANMQEKDEDYTSALTHCAYNGHLEAAALLIDRGCFVRVVYNDKGHTPLHASACNGHLAVTQLLIDKGGCVGEFIASTKTKKNVDPKDKKGATPLHLSAQNGHLEVSRLLIANGHPVDVEDHDGFQPLHLSIDKGHAEVSRLLVDKGARFDAMTNSGLTPLEISSKDRPYVEAEAHKACAQIMVEAKDNDTPDKAAKQAARDQHKVYDPEKARRLAKMSSGGKHSGGSTWAFGGGM